MAKIKLEPRAEYSPSELIKLFEAGDKKPQDIIDLVKKIGLDDPNFFKSDAYKQIQSAGFQGAHPVRLKKIREDFYDAMGGLNRVTSEKDTLPAQDGYKTETFDIRKQPGSRAIKEGSRPSVQLNTPEAPILTGDDEKKSFFDRLLSKENRPFLENLGMKLGTTLTAPMNPGENRSLINQVATSIQGASDKTAADEAAEVSKLLAGAQAKKALAESGGQTTLIKNALANVAMQFPNLDQNSDAFKQKVAQAMRQFGIKDITTAQINSYIKLSQLESELKMLNDPKDPEYIKKALEIEAFKKNLAEGGLGTGGGDGRNIVKFEDL